MSTLLRLYNFPSTLLFYMMISRYPIFWDAAMDTGIAIDTICIAVTKYIFGLQNTGQVPGNISRAPA
jgi:hypothetical protein